MFLLQSILNKLSCHENIHYIYDVVVLLFEVKSLWFIQHFLSIVVYHFALVLCSWNVWRRAWVLVFFEHFCHHFFFGIFIHWIVSKYITLTLLRMNIFLFLFFFFFEKAVTPCYKGFLFHDIRFYEGLTIIVIAVKWNWFKMFILFHKGMNNWWIYLMMNWRISFAFSDANIWLFTTKID